MCLKPSILSNCPGTFNRILSQRQSYDICIFDKNNVIGRQ